MKIRKKKMSLKEDTIRIAGILLTTGLSVFFVFSSLAQAAVPVKRVSINEVAWAGTKASPFDEWIELKNNTKEKISLAGWKLAGKSGRIDIVLSGSIPPEGFYLLERTDDNTVSDILCDLIYKGALVNTGDTLELVNSEGKVEDTANKRGGAWPAGKASPDYISMERIDPLGEDIPSNWEDNDCTAVCGVDTEGNPVNGTPASTNSAFFLK